MKAEWIKRDEWFLARADNHRLQEVIEQTVVVIACIRLGDWIGELWWVGGAYLALWINEHPDLRRVWRALAAAVVIGSILIAIYLNTSRPQPQPFDPDLTRGSALDTFPPLELLDPASSNVYR